MSSRKERGTEDRDGMREKHIGGGSGEKTGLAAFWRSLDYSDGLQTIVRILRRFPMQYGTTLGLDGNPQVRPLEFKFEENGRLYFDTVTEYTSYREMQAHPYLQLCIGDQETETYLRVGGKVRFTSDPEIIRKCFANSPVLRSQFGDHPEKVIAYYLTDVKAEFASFCPDLPNRTYTLPDPEETGRESA